MPKYNTVSPPFAVFPGDIQAIVSAETLGTNQTSQQVAIARPYGHPSPLSITFAYAAAPASVSYDIQAANEDVDALYIKIGNTTNVNGDRVDISGVALNFKFLRVKEITTPSQNATIKVLG
jgi:hypothetical protein